MPPYHVQDSRNTLNTVHYVDMQRLSTMFSFSNFDHDWLMVWGTEAKLHKFKFFNEAPCWRWSFGVQGAMSPYWANYMNIAIGHQKNQIQHLTRSYSALNIVKRLESCFSAAKVARWGSYIAGSCSYNQHLRGYIADSKRKKGVIIPNNHFQFNRCPKFRFPNQRRLWTSSYQSPTAAMPVLFRSLTSKLLHKQKVHHQSSIISAYYCLL